MTRASKELADLMAFDSLAVAEQLTGVSYKEDEATGWLGMGLMMENNRIKDKALADVGDTHNSITYAEFLKVLEHNGFTVVLEDPFTGRNGVVEKFAMLWHPCGILATVESYNAWESRGVNSASIYYNLRTPDGNWPDWKISSSGRINDGVLVGDHDAREGVITKIVNLASAGEFLPNWIERPHLWLVNYMERPDSSLPWSEQRAYFHSISDERISRLPEFVREAITP